MSFQLATEHIQRVSRPSWANVAFIIEAMLLLVFLIGSLAVFMQLFSAALLRSAESGATTNAVAAASTVAERFTADPRNVATETEVGNMHVTCDVTPVKHSRGTLYQAEITVYGSNSIDAPASVSATGDSASSANASEKPGASASAASTSKSGAGSDEGVLYTLATSVYVSEAS